jgi:hypothetical protein
MMSAGLTSSGKSIEVISSRNWIGELPFCSALK